MTTDRDLPPNNAYRNADYGKLHRSATYGKSAYPTIYTVKEIILGSRRKCECIGCTSFIVFVLESLDGQEVELCVSHGSNAMRGV